MCRNKVTDFFDLIYKYMSWPFDKLAKMIVPSYIEDTTDTASIVMYEIAFSLSILGTLSVIFSIFL